MGVLKVILSVILEEKVTIVWGSGGGILVKKFRPGCNIRLGWGWGGEMSELRKVIKQNYDFGSPYTLVLLVFDPASNWRSADVGHCFRMGGRAFEISWILVLLAVS